jgi:hypothetical protein
LPLCPGQIWGLPSLLSNWYLGLKWPGMKLTTHVHPLPWLRMCGTIPPLPQYIFMAWCLVKHRDSFTFYHFHMAQKPIPGKFLPVFAIFNPHGFLKTVCCGDIIFNICRVFLHVWTLLLSIYFCSIPDSSDDDHAESSHEDARLSPVNNSPRQHRSRIPSVPVSFCTQRKCLGKKRSRYYNNG